MTTDNVLISLAVGFTAGVFGLVFSPAAAIVLGFLGFACALGALSNTARGTSVDVTLPSVHVSTPWYRRGFFATGPTLVGHRRTAIAVPRPLHTTTPHSHTAPALVVKRGTEVHASRDGVSFTHPVQSVSFGRNRRA